jgi:hypothetical protein
VISQAQVDQVNAQYVENVMWIKGDVLFATANITGSNDDKADWGTPLGDNVLSYPSQSEERVMRKRANQAWINQAFARATNAKALVLAIQADMRDATPATRVGTIDDYDAYVVQIGTLAQKFSKPVLRFSRRPTIHATVPAVQPPSKHASGAECDSAGRERKLEPHRVCSTDDQSRGEGRTHFHLGRSPAAIRN